MLKCLEHISLKNDTEVKYTVSEREWLQLTEEGFLKEDVRKAEPDLLTKFMCDSFLYRLFCFQKYVFEASDFGPVWYGLIGGLLLN